MPTLSRDGKGARLAHSHREEFERSATKPASFPAHWNEADVHGALLAGQWRICAYCGRTMNSVFVDHFRPKSSYWWLAYRMENFLLCCFRCNNPAHKGAKFPMRRRGRNYTYAKRSRLRQEPRALLDPAVDDIETWLSVTDDPEAYVALCSSDSAPAIARQQVEKTLAIFRLNTDSRLLRERSKVRDQVLAALCDGDRHRARQLAVRYQPHSVVARALLESLRPEWLPGPAFELKWLLQRMLREFDHLLKLLERSDDALNQRACERLLWSFAVLWQAPPASRGNTVESFLEVNGLAEVVRPYRERLT